jgi:hypothetical protein
MSILRRDLSRVRIKALAYLFSILAVPLTLSWLVLAMQESFLLEAFAGGVLRWMFSCAKWG